MKADVIVVGAGLAGLVAAAEAADAGRTVLLLDQEGEQSLGGQAFWSLGGLFLVDSPEQRRMGVKDSLDLARQDWFGSAAFDRPEDHWPRAWAEAYLQFAAGEKRSWLRGQGHRLFPVVGWAERGDGTRRAGTATRCPGSTSPGAPAPAWSRRSRAGCGRTPRPAGSRSRSGTASTASSSTGPRWSGSAGRVLEPTTVERGRAEQPHGRSASSRRAAQAVIVTSGGIGGDHDLVRKAWPARLGTPPKRMVSGVPAHVDGRMLGITAGGGRERHQPRPDVALRRGPAELGPDLGEPRHPHPARPVVAVARRHRPPAARAAASPASTPSARCGTCAQTGYDYSWFVLTQKIIEKEFALSGSEQNPDLTGKDVRLLLSRVRGGAPGPVEAFKQHGEDFVVAATVEELVAGMNKLADPDVPALEADALRAVDGRARPAVGEHLQQGRADHGDPRRPAPTAATGWCGSPPRTACSTRRPAR